MKNEILLFLCLLLLNGCKLIGEGDELSLERMPFEGSELKLNGYFIEEFNQDSLRQVLFLFKNGVVFNAGWFRHPDIDDIQEQLVRGNPEKTQEVKHEWGIFLVNSDSIIIETWDSMNYGIKYAFKSKGQILNDSTFLLLSSIRSRDEGKEDPTPQYQKFHFKKFLFKPDSLTSFIR